MIVFHEGLPGAGKSYEACVNHILPALLAGRTVVTNIAGINLDKFAEVSGIPRPYLEKTLIPVFDLDLEKQKAAILQTPKDSLLVIDEIQNLFPAERQKLSDDWNKFVTEHRHLGLDIILMGQDRRDCHALWRRRIQRVILFLKLDAVGASSSYRWELFEATSPEKYQKISGGIKKYDPKYYGLYASYEEGAEHKKSYTDKRGNILKTPAFMVGIPVFVFALFFAVNTLAGFFKTETGDYQHPEPDILADIEPGQTQDIHPHPQPRPANNPNPPPPPIPEYVPVDVFDAAAHNRRLRLTGLIYSKTKLMANIEVLDAQKHVYDTFTVKELQALGWIVINEPYGLLISKGSQSYVARPFDIDNPSQLNRRLREQI